MFQNQVNHICINLNLALYYIRIKNSGSNYTCVCIQTKSYMYVSPLYIYSIYPPFHNHCQCLLRRLDLFSGCSMVIPNAEQEGHVVLAETADKPKFVS